MKKLAIIGKFDTPDGVSDGQAVKTNILTEELERRFGVDQVWRISTYQWKKAPHKLFLNCLKAVGGFDNVMFLTDEGGIRIFPKLLRIANFARKAKIHYYVVGGWLSRYLDSSPAACAELKKLDAIYVEIPAMLQELEDRGFRNGILVNKFRRMTPVATSELDLNPQTPCRLCYFSRVMQEKGIEESIEAVKIANERAGYVRFSLDIYGSVHEPYREAFEKMQRSFPSFIHYCGIVDYHKSGHVLKDHFAMLFPTFYPSEGYPNAVVDAYAAGLPVIATRWNYNTDIIRNGKDGILVDVGDVKQLVVAMESIADDPDAWASMRLNCLARCREYLPEYAVDMVAAQLK